MEMEIGTQKEVDIAEPRVEMTEPAPTLPLAQTKLEVRNLKASFGPNTILKGVDINIPDRRITAIMGPSGCGKTTFIRCLNRLHELTPGARVEGEVIMDGSDIYAPGTDPVAIRRRIGMVFQKPNPFPTMSVYDNVAAGLKLGGVRDKKLINETVERSLRLAFLWDEVKNELKKSGSALSGGQQQRLCIARALAVSPEVLLMDEPASALDPTATAKIEEAMARLKKDYTIVIVTHNMQQAARVADYTAFFYLGELVEFGLTADLFEKPKQELTERYITGKFG
jgi:phosphate transport system ATP-binding protein